MPGSPIGSFLQGFSRTAASAVASFREKKKLKEVTDAKAAAAANESAAKEAEAMSTATTMVGLSGLTPFKTPGLVQKKADSGAAPTLSGETEVKVGSPIDGQASATPGLDPTGFDPQKAGPFFDLANAAATLLSNGVKFSEAQKLVKPFAWDLQLKAAGDPIYAGVVADMPGAGAPLRIKEYERRKSQGQEMLRFKNENASRILALVNGDVTKLDEPTFARLVSFVTPSLANSYTDLRTAGMGDSKVFTEVAAMFSTHIGQANGELSAGQLATLTGAAIEKLVGAGVTPNVALQMVKTFYTPTKGGDKSIIAKLREQARTPWQSFVVKSTAAGASLNSRYEQARRALRKITQGIPLIQRQEEKLKSVGLTPDEKAEIGGLIKQIKKDYFGDAFQTSDKARAGGGLPVSIAGRVAAFRERFGGKGEFSLSNEGDKILVAEIMSDFQGPDSGGLGDKELNVYMRVANMSPGDLSFMSWRAYVDAFMKLTDENGDFDPQKVAEAQLKTERFIIDQYYDAKAMRDGGKASSSFNTSTLSTQDLAKRAAGMIGGRAQ